MTRSVGCTPYNKLPTKRVSADAAALPTATPTSANVRPASESILPEFVPDYCYRRTIHVLGPERSSALGFHFQRVEEIRRGNHSKHTLLTVSCFEASPENAGNICERMAVARIFLPIAIADEDFRLRRTRRFALEHDGQSIRTREVQRLQKPRIQNAEHRRIGANPERQQNHNQRSESGSPEEHPHRMFQIRNHFEPSPKHFDASAKAS